MHSGVAKWERKCEIDEGNFGKSKKLDGRRSGGKSGQSGERIRDRGERRGPSNIIVIHCILLASLLCLYAVRTKWGGTLAHLAFTITSLFCLTKLFLKSWKLMEQKWTERLYTIKNYFTKDGLYRSCITNANLVAYNMVLKLKRLVSTIS